MATVFEDSITTSANVAGTTVGYYRRDLGGTASAYSGALTIEAFYLNSLRVNFVAGTNLKQYPVQKNDRVIIKSSGGGAGAAVQIGNDGSWRVDRVLGPTLVKVDTAARGTTTLVKRDGLSKGTGTFKLGAWNAVFVDEPIADLASIKYKATAPGSATGHSFITDHFYAGGSLSVFPYIGLQGIELLHTNATPTAYTSSGEVILNTQVMPYPMKGAYALNKKSTAIWVRGASDTHTIGTLGTDSSSTRAGSFLVGWHVQNADVFGSVWSGSQGQAGFSDTQRVYNSINYDSSLTSNGTTDFKNVITMPASFPIFATNPGGTYSNVILSGSPGTSASLNLFTSDITMSNLTVAQSVFDSLPGGIFNAVGAFLLILLDLTSNYDLLDLVTAGNVSKRYSYRPTFVTRNDTGTAPLPVAGLNVKVWQIDDVNVETLVFDDVTDLNGQLNAGAGLNGVYTVICGTASNNNNIVRCKSGVPSKACTRKGNGIWSCKCDSS